VSEYVWSQQEMDQVEVTIHLPSWFSLSIWSLQWCKW